MELQVITLAQTRERRWTHGHLGPRPLFQGPGVLGPAHLNSSPTVPGRYRMALESLWPVSMEGGGGKSREDLLWG